MEDVVKVEGWPDITECIQWSDDNVIVAAAKDTLNILVSRRDITSQSGIVV